MDKCIICYGTKDYSLIEDYIKVFLLIDKDCRQGRIQEIFTEGVADRAYTGIFHERIIFFNF